MDIRARGADQLADLSRALKAAGDKELTRELLRGIQRSTKGVRADMKEAARDDLPQSGGLNQAVAASKFSTRTRRGGRNPGVRITVTGKKVSDVRSIDRGRLRHPVFARGTNRREWTWVTQTITPGVFTRPFMRSAPEVRRELLRVMQDVVQKIARRAQ